MSKLPQSIVFAGHHAHEPLGYEHHFGQILADRAPEAIVTLYLVACGPAREVQLVWAVRMHAMVLMSLVHSLMPSLMETKA